MIVLLLDLQTNIDSDGLYED